MDAILAWADKYFHLFSIIGSLSFTVAALSFLSSAISTRQSVKAHDFKTISDITTDIFAAWQTIRDNTDPDKRAYLVAELLNKYERACFFINNKVVGRTGRYALSEIICDGILIILSDKELSGHMRDFRDEEEIFNDIRIFFRKYHGPSKTDPLLVKLTGRHPRRSWNLSSHKRPKHRMDAAANRAS